MAKDVIEHDLGIIIVQCRTKFCAVHAGDTFRDSGALDQRVLRNDQTV